MSKLPIPHQPLKQSIYHGTFIHCETQVELSILKGYIWVGSDGKIGGFVAEAEASSAGQLIQKLDWDEKETIVEESLDNSFYFPGFIGMLLKPSQIICIYHLALLTLLKTRIYMLLSTPTLGYLAKVLF